MAAPGVDLFDEYFRRADLDRDGRISGAEAVAFFQGSNLPKPVLAQVWTFADQNRIGYLGRQEFYNALKLVTVAQSGRALTPEIVRSALFGPAAAKIPAPKINPVSSSAPQMNSTASPVFPTTRTLPTNSVLPSSNQFGALAANAPNNLGVRPTQIPQNVTANQQFFATVNSNLATPAKATPSSTSTQMHGSLSGAGSLSGVNHPSSNTSNLSSDWLGSGIAGGSVGVVSQNPVKAISSSPNPGGFGVALPGMTTGVPPQPQTQSPLAASVVPKALDVLSSPSTSSNQSKSSVVSGNGFSSDSIFGGDIFSATSQAKPNAVNFMSSMSSSVTTASVAVGSQNLVKSGQLPSTQNNWSIPPSATQHQWSQSNVKQNQPGNMGTNITVVTPGVSAGTVSSASNQNQLQWPKISQPDIKKYTKVFLDVDKDRDGKITGVEARNLFLSWRLPREVLKQVWDLSDQDNDSMLSLREFCIALYLMERYREGRPLPEALPSSLMYDETLLRVTSMPSGAFGSPSWQPGLQQQGLSGPRPPVPVVGVRPLMQNSATFLADSAVQSVQPISGAPASENQMMNILVKEKETTDMNQLEAAEPAKEVEKQILDSREKLEFYRTKMQDLVLYKSRCDNRLNEITERASADRREVELLGKKYEEKYKQVGEIASKLAVEEARNRDIQERKTELHNAIIKMEQGGSADGLLQVRVDRIQSDLEELEKALIERCKQHGVNVKSTTSVELPFGWQPVPQEGAAVWDENWDKFEDEGFTVLKDLTDLVNTPNAKPTSPSVWSDKASDDFSPVDEQIEKSYAIKEQMNGSAYDHSEEGSTRSPRSSSGRSTLESPFNSVQFGTHDMSPRYKETHSDQVGAESTVSGDKYSDEPWTFDDTDSVWGSSAPHAKEVDHESSPRNTFFMSSDFGSMKVGSPSASSVYGKDKSSPFFEDSVPSSPVFNSSSPSKFNDSREDYSFNNFGGFDSFATHDSGFFSAHDDGLSKFDSMSSNRPESLSRFDSISSSKDFGHSRAFESFDDADPFGSTGPFRASGDRSPKKDSDNWRAF